MRKIIWAAALATVWATSACEKTGEGEYEVQKPVVGSETDTVETPEVETGTVRDTINVPDVDVDVKSEKKGVKVPKVEVKE